MEKVNFKTYDEIVNYLGYINLEYNKSYQELNNISIGKFEITGKKDKEVQKRELRIKLLDYVLAYQQWDSFLKDATTFRRQDIVRFLAEYFSITYGTKYVVESDISDKKQVQSVIIYDLIVSERDLKKNNGNNKMMKSLDFSTFFDSCSDCCLLLDNSLKFTLLDGINLSGNFEDFPELMTVARRLVDLKLTNPEMSDQRRLMSVLSGTCLDLVATYDEEVKTGYKLSKNFN